MCSGACRAYSPGTHARIPCNPTRTRSM
jgi:hypothetical protein